MTNPTTPTANTPPVVPANVAGTLQVWIGPSPGSSSTATIQFLGYTVNGVQIMERPFVADVKSDEAGGDHGPPVDIQLFGAEHHISIEIERYNDTVLAELERFYNNTTAVAVGGLLNQSGSTVRVLICSADLTTFVRNYPICYLRDDIRKPVGSKVTRATLSFRAYQYGSTAPWNLTTT